MKKNLTILAVNILVFGFISLITKEGFAKCEAAYEKFHRAVIERDRIAARRDVVKKRYDQATDKLSDATKTLQEIARSLGAEGEVSMKSIMLQRSPSNPAFFEDKRYKKAKSEWEAAKHDHDKATSDLKIVEVTYEEANNECEAAEKEFLKLRAEHRAEENIEVQPLKIPDLRWIINDEKTVSAKETEKGTEVEVTAKCKEEDTIKIEIISDPPGMLKLKDAKLTSPEGVIYTPKQKYEKTLVRLGKPVYTSPRQASFSSGAAMGALVGGAFVGGSGGSRGGGESCAKPCGESGGGYSSPDYVGAGTGLLSVAMSQAGRADRTQAAVGRARRPIEKSIRLSVVEFKCPPSKDRVKPWSLNVDMTKKDDAAIPYTFTLYLGSLVSKESDAGEVKAEKDKETAARNKELADLFRKQAAKDRKQAAEIRKTAEAEKEKAAHYRAMEEKKRDFVKKVASYDNNDPDKVKVIEDNIFEADKAGRLASGEEKRAQAHEKQAEELQAAAEKSEKRAQELEKNSKK
jgi:hypothetical protein